jgi:hypothetical protein
MSMSSFGHRDQRADRKHPQRRRRLAIEPLEGREMLSTFTVTSAADTTATASGTLRWAIAQSNNVAATAAAPNRIAFDLPGSDLSDGLYAIDLQSALPALTQPVVIDGTSQPGANGEPVIQVDGTNAGPTAVGLQVEPGASGSTINRLTVTGFAASGVLLDGASTVTLSGADVGVANLSSGAVAEGNGTGVALLDGASHNTLIDDTVSGNFTGVGLSGPGTTANDLIGNYIGLDPYGNAAVPNVYGVYIAGGATQNLVDTDGDTMYSTIAGNSGCGVYITGSGTTGNDVEATNFGAAVAYGTPVPNYDGIIIAGGASDNTIGATFTPDDISYSTNDGIDITGPGTDGNVVELSADERNGDDGVKIENRAADNTVEGALIADNRFAGVEIQTGAAGNIVGGTMASAGDRVTVNGTYGVYIHGSGTNGNLVEGDTIGVVYTGLGGNVDGVEIASGAAGNTVGGTTGAAADVISGNTLDGVQLTDSGPGNVIEGNFLGTDSGGTGPLGNGRAGVTIQGGSTGNIVGGTAPGAANVISANGRYGVWVIDPGTSGNVIEGDFIGTGLGGTQPLGNGFAGVDIQNQASFNTVGGTAAGAGNVISANGTYGVLVNGTGANFNVVAGDFIGTNLGATSALGNDDGVDVENGAADNVIGGTTTAARNIISGNALDGVQLSSSGINNVVEGNYVGTDVSGSSAIPNARDGVMIQGGSSDDFVGVGLGNLIAYNGNDGVQVTWGCFNNTIELDTIVNNGANGVELDGDAYDTVAACFIGGNGQWGILDAGSNDALVNNWVFGNNARGGVGY